MSRFRKIALIVSSILVVLLIALIVLAQVLITPERVRETVVPLAEEALDRKVELGEIDVSLFSGISLQDMAIRKRTGEGHFVAFDKVVLRYSLLALLMMKVEVDEVSLVGPEIELVRNRDGSFNFSDLIDNGSESSTSAPADSSSEGAPIDLHVSSVSVDNGRLLFVDHSVQGAAQKHEVTAFNFKARDVSMADAFPLDLSADWNGNSLGLNGQINPAETGGEVAARFNKVLVNLSGGMKNDKLKAVVTLPETSLADLFTSIPKEYAPDFDATPFQGNLTFKVDINDDVVNATDVVAVVNDQKLSLELDASALYGDMPRVQLRVNSDSIDLDKLIPASPEGSEGVGEPEEVGTQSETGPFNVPLAFDGQIRIARLVSQGVPLSDLQLDVRLAENILHIDNLKTSIAGGSFEKSGQVNLGVKGLKYATEISIDGISAREMMQLASPDLAGAVEGSLDSTIKLSGAGTVLETARKKLSGGGTFHLKNGKLQSIPALNAIAALLDSSELRAIEVDDGTLNFKVQNGKVEIDSILDGSRTRMKTTGQVSLSGDMDLRSQLSLSPELGGRLHENGKLVRYLGDDGGWTTVPIRVKGNYDSPDVGLDSKGLKKQAEKAVKKKAQEKLEKALEKKLKGLFGR